MMTRLNEKLDQMRADLEEVREQASVNTKSRGRRSKSRFYEHDEEGSNSEEEEKPRRSKVDENLKSIQMRVPEFQGKSDPELYLTWEKKVERIFEIHNYSEEKKVKLAAVEFSDYALTWWDQLCTNRRRYGEDPVSTWAEMKKILRKRYVPPHYYRELHKKLQTITQGNRSVDEYYKEMHLAMIRANIEEDPEATMARFLNGLNREIVHVVELQHYVDIEELVHKAEMVEKHLKQKPVASRSSNTSTNSWKGGNNWNKGNSGKKFTPTTSSKVNSDSKVSNSRGSSTNNASRPVTCFKCLGKGHIASQCPNSKTMVMLEDGSYAECDEAEDENNEEFEEMPPLEESGEDELNGEDGACFVSVRALNTHSKLEEDVQQRQNIFHTKCRVKDKVCLLIIDSGSCTNVASTYLVENLSLPIRKHPQPYRLQWLNTSGEVKVTKQVMVPFSIGEYQEEVLCDVAPMDAAHMILGRPWEYDHKTRHDGFTNKYHFVANEKPITLVPLTPNKSMNVMYKCKLKERKGKE